MTSAKLLRDNLNSRQSSFIDLNDHKQLKSSSAKVLVFNGKCSEIFKSALEDCVEDCILEFPGENSVYVSKPGQSVQLSSGNRQTSAINSRESSALNIHQLSKSSRRRSSVTQFNLPQISGTRISQNSTHSSSAATNNSSRIRHQLIQQKTSFVEDITEETDDIRSIIEQTENLALYERNQDVTPINQEETISRQSNLDLLSYTPTLFNRKLTPNSNHLPYPNHKKYRLSDLVMLGPEHFSHVFHFQRKSHSSMQQSNPKTIKRLNELDHIKQDLFHRYLWTQKPQVSCRIRRMSTYPRSATFVN